MEHLPTYRQYLRGNYLFQARIPQQYYQIIKEKLLYRKNRQSDIPNSRISNFHIIQNVDKRQFHLAIHLNNGWQVLSVIERN